MSDLPRRDLDLFHHWRRQLPVDPTEARGVLAGLVAKWGVPAPGSAAKKPRATATEMAQRHVATWWLMTTAGRPLSVRGVAYRAEALLALPKTENAFRLIEEATVDLRDSALASWSLIRDGRRSVSWHDRREDISHTLEIAQDDHRLDLWAQAPLQAQVWIEKEGLVGAIAPRAHEIGLNVYAASGFTGAGFLRVAMEGAAEDGRPLVVLQLVDYDSSGNRMRESAERRSRTFADDLDVHVEAIERVALTRAQIDQHSIPTRPQKESSHRRDEDDKDAAELDAVDALHPDLLGDWLEQAVEPYWGAEDRRPALDREANDDRVLAGLVAKWPEVERWLAEEVDA